MSTRLRTKVRRYGPSALSVGIALSVGVGFFVTAPQTATSTSADRPTASVATFRAGTGPARVEQSVKLTTPMAAGAKAVGR